MTPVKEKIFKIICLADSLLVLAYLTFWNIGTWELRVTFYSLGLIGAVLYYSQGRQSEEVTVPTDPTTAGRKPSKWAVSPIDLVLILLMIIVWVYTMLGGVDLIRRAGTFPTRGDVIIGTALVVLSLELGRRTSGLILPIITLVVFFYGLFGQYFPGLLYHSGISYARLISNLYSQQGIFGELVGLIPTYVFAFITLGAFLEYCKAGNLLMDIAYALVGKAVGGPAKACVVASSLMGTITGSTVTSVMTIGTFTIPLMKRSGVSSKVAGAIEAVAGTGAQIMPPVMGVAAFVLAENLSTPYNKVALAGFIPAIFYYFSLFSQIHLYSLRRGVKGESGRKLWELFYSRWYLLMSIVLLIILLFIVEMSAVRAGLWSILATLIFSWFGRDTRMGFKTTIEALIKGVQGLLVMLGICATAGMVIQLLDVTGLGLLFTGALMKTAGNNYWLCLMVIAVICLILGMGMPTVPAYILAAVVGCPVLIKLGIQPFVAHFYVFYYACMSSITPPVALGAYAASSISKSSPWNTGWYAVRLGVVGLLVPIALVCQPPLLLLGTPTEIVMAVAFSTAGVICLALSFEGYWLGRFSLVLRIPVFVSGLVLFIAHSIQYNLAGLVVAMLCLSIAFVTNRKMAIQGGAVGFRQW
jgi:TRAP transporter 4TM/12TM fusion protein